MPRLGDSDSMVPQGACQRPVDQPMPNPLFLPPMVQLIGSSRMMPDTGLPTARSSTDRQGTRLNSCACSIMA